jgi:muramidase (phage lysozyme)
VPRAIVVAIVSTIGVTGVIASPVAAADETTTTTTTTTSSTTTTTTTTAPVNSAPPATTPTTAAPTTAAPTSTTSITAPTTTIAAPSTTVAPAPRNVIVYPNQIANILATIRYVESRGNYAAPLNKGRASGAYQFITSTWNNYGGYLDAYLAPPEIQDERAAADVNRFLVQWNNDVSMIPVMWYYPRAASDIALMDIVPVPSAGNVLTVREYQQRWLGVWAFLAGQPIPRPVTFADQLARLGLAPELPASEAVDPSTPAAERTARVVFPVLGPTRLAAPDCGDAQDVDQNAGASGSQADIEAAGLCAEEAPGIIFGVKMQPVLAVVDGVITDVVDAPGGTITVTITDTTGRSFELAGFNDDNPGTNDGAAPPHLSLTRLAVVGQSVRAGQVLGFMGDTDPLPLGIRSDVPTDATVDIPVDQVAPHIRLTINDLDGTPVDAYGPVIDALFRQVCSIGIGPWSGLQNGVGLDPVVTETTDDNRDIDSEWEVTSTGDVIASGWAAMIYPSESCGWAPPDKRGPGAGGATSIPDGWMTPIDLATSIWVELAVRDDTSLNIPMMRP